MSTPRVLTSSQPLGCPTELRGNREGSWRTSTPGLALSEMTGKMMAIAMTEWVTPSSSLKHTRVSSTGGDRRKAGRPGAGRLTKAIEADHAPRRGATTALLVRTQAVSPQGEAREAGTAQEHRLEDSCYSSKKCPRHSRVGTPWGWLCHAEYQTITMALYLWPRCQAMLSTTRSWMGPHPVLLSKPSVRIP